MIEPVDGDIGARLRESRRQSGRSLREIADSTKYSVRTLEALEQNQLGDLPDGIYRRGIIRAYASEVGLDPSSTVRALLAYQSDADQSDEAPEQLRMTLAVERGPRRRSLASTTNLIGALVPVFAGLSYFTLNARGSDVPQHVADLIAPRVSVVSDAIPAVAAIDSVTNVGPISLMISVSSRCQLQVVADSTEVLARYLEAGEVIRVSLDSDVVLLGDNAGAVHFSINGRAGRSLGDAGSPLGVRIARNDYQAWLIQP